MFLVPLFFVLHSTGSRCYFMLLHVSQLCTLITILCVAHSGSVAHRCRYRPCILGAPLKDLCILVGSHFALMHLDSSIADGCSTDTWRVIATLSDISVTLSLASRLLYNYLERDYTPQTQEQPHCVSIRGVELSLLRCSGPSPTLAALWITAFLLVVVTMSETCIDPVTVPV